MWDYQPVMSFGDPLYQKLRGYETPNLNKLAEEGLLFSRLYAENGCTPSRCASLTGQSFYLAWWPQWTSFVPNKPKTSLQRGMVGDAYQSSLDPTVGELMTLLHDLGIAENTLIVAMADNGPMVHDPPPGLGMGSGLYRGGKGDITEGGVRVCAAAWWPGMIEGGQIA